MSEFFDAKILKCPYCKTRFASCEGMLCDCYEYLVNKEIDELDEENK